MCELENEPHWVSAPHDSCFLLVFLSHSQAVLKIVLVCVCVCVYLCVYVCLCFLNCGFFPAGIQPLLSLGRKHPHICCRGCVNYWMSKHLGENKQSYS